MKKHVIIVAGGSGTRMGGPVPKQYMTIGNLPILMWTIQAFFENDSGVNILLVIPENDFEYWDKLCKQYTFQVPHQVVGGGKSRFQSVRNGLNALKGNDGLVAIHDGVRPFVSREVIDRSFEVALEEGSAIAVMPLKDSIRKLTDDGRSFYQERQYFRLVQTPQTFQLSKIRKAFEIGELHHFTDDATVYEHQGWQVTMIPGNLENIKITTPEDLDYAEYLLNKK
ncbi:2-C-methyl-D-erythritol 4-phosphate cytidylyltransferase [Pleomorphovibrio marinus]|uniref:2-C-methyl-D-erythritol 4-phosphate cytidylyltransferase n=1 Tax=Pleomorphovibrio marinus TaxID=2164132 RepID=UPI000E0C0542|nr:2-C-methyl-D-erythritol 4-phosphate cytidylyltransferase [Pleomorphovibrio marinus]